MASNNIISTVDDNTDQISFISHYYPNIFTQILPNNNNNNNQGEAKPRRKRKKKACGGGGDGATSFRKRKLSDEQVSLLEQSFGDEHKLESERKDRLASELGLDPRQIAVWFQNRRARWKNKKLEEEYSKLKIEHESTVVDKCRLETQVLKLKERLCEAENKIQMLLERGSDGVSSNSPSTSSFPMEALPPLFAEFGGGGGFDDVFSYAGDENHYGHVLDQWMKLYGM